MSDNDTNKSGIGGDVRRLRESGGASIGELREFLGTLKGKRPHEVMGTIASNSLVRSVIISTVACFALIIVLTVIPFLLRDETATAKTETAEVTASESESSEQGESSLSEQASSAATQDAQPSNDDVMDALGIGETKVAPEDENPLDNNNDLQSLLDGK